MKQRVLVIRFSAMGDLILTTGPLAQLRKKYPGLIIDILTSELGSELYLNSLEIDSTYILNKGSGLSEALKTYKQLPKYDKIIDLQGTLKSKWIRLFQRTPIFTVEKQSRERRAFVKSRKFKDALSDHVVQKYYKTLQRAFPELPYQDLESLRPVFPRHPLIFTNQETDWSKAVALHPFASQKNKEWPYFVELAKTLIDRKTPVILLGHSEQKLQLPDSPLIMNLVNTTSLREMASVLSSVKAFVTTDSGPMHMGLAVNTPTLALFGPTTKELGFAPRFTNSWILEKDLDCRPCHVHGGDICSLKHHNCMVELTLDQVLEKLQPLL